MAKKKKVTKAALTKKLDRIFSRYIRLAARDGDGWVKCFTCKHRQDPLKPGIHAGHWIPRQHMATRWEEWNVHPQCYSCNMFYGGRPQEYRERLVELHGEEQVQQWAQLRHTVRQWTHDEIEHMIRRYSLKVKRLEG